MRYHFGVKYFIKLLFEKESSGNIKFFIALNFDNG